MRATVLTFDSEAFAQMRKDMDATLQATIRTMLEKGCDTAKFAVTLTIDLKDDLVPDKEIPTHYAEREIIEPKIEHKVTSSLQIKTETKGKIGGKGFELVRGEDGKYILMPINGEQISVFDEDDSVDDDEVDVVVGGNEEDDEDA